MEVQRKNILIQTLLQDGLIQGFFIHQFECEKALSKSRIKNCVDHFEKYGSVKNLFAAGQNCQNYSMSQEAYSQTGQEYEK